jgi:limonene-1,2-epoxide hydrolase
MQGFAAAGGRCDYEPPRLKRDTNRNDNARVGAGGDGPRREAHMERTREVAFGQPRDDAGRRAFLLTALAAGAANLVPSAARGAQSGDTRTAVRLVTEFCASVSKLEPAAMRPFLADDVVYRMTETTPPIVGADGVLDAYRRLNATSIEFKVLDTLTAGPIVINRRIDRFVSPRSFTWEGVGVFFVKDGRIKEWSDYTIRMERG